MSRAGLFLGLLLVLAARPTVGQGTWSTRAPMPTKRGGFAVAALNGKIYVVGGQLQNSSAVTGAVEAYDPATDTWIAKSPMPTPRHSLGLAAANGHLYAIGGCTTNDCSGLVSTAEAYDPVSDTWSAKAPMPTPRRSFATGVIDGVIYAAGGLQGPGSSGISVNEAYDPLSNTWSIKSAMPTPRGSPFFAVLNNGLFAIGGYNGNGVVYTAVEAYDPASDSWAVRAPLPSARTGSTGAVMGTKIYCAGGGGADNQLVSYDLFANAWGSQPSPPTAPGVGANSSFFDGVLFVIGDGANNGTNQAFTPSTVPTWTFTGNMNTPRYGASGTRLLDGRFLVAGGVDAAGNILSSAEIYSPTSGTWTLTSPMVQPQVGVAVLLKDGRVLVYGGSVAGGPGGVTNFAQIFDPLTGQWTATGSMNQCRQSFTGTLLANGQALAVGGYCGGYLSSVELYNPSTGTWSFTGSLPGPVANASAILLPNGKVLVAGGTTGFAVTRAELFDPSSGTWGVTGSLNQARAWSFRGTMLLNSGQVLAVGGVGGSGCGSFVSSAEFYDPASGAWTLTGSLGTALEQDLLVRLADGRVLSSGGVTGNCSSSSYLNTAQVYDPSSGAWSATAAMNQARAGHVGTLLLDGRVLVASGTPNGGLTALNSAELYSFQPSLGATSTTVSTMPASPVYGQSVTLTATVAPTSGSGTPTGTVTFYDGATTLGTATLSGGQAAFTSSSLSVGSHTITAVYSGDSSFSGSTSAPLTQTVNKASTQTTVSSSANPSTVSQSVTFTANISVVSLGAGTPTGTVTFQDGAAVLGTVPLSLSGSGMFTTSSLSLGSHSITATYSGDASFSASTGMLSPNQAIQYGFLGLLAPYAPPTQRTFKIPSAVPLKWQYTDFAGIVVASSSAAPAVNIVSTPCGGSGGSPITINDAGNSGLQYDSLTNTWQFNWKTTGLSAGCYSISISSGQTGQTNGPFPTQLQ